MFSVKDTYLQNGSLNSKVNVFGKSKIKTFEKQIMCPVSKLSFTDS